MSYDRIILTGVPCTGKTTIADKLGQALKTQVIHLTEFAKQNDLIIGKDKENDSLIVDIKGLKELLKDKKGIIEGHLACEVSLPNSFVIVMRCNPKELRKRLENRGYATQKIKDNIESEALDYCVQLAEQNYKKVFQVDTTGLSKDEAMKKCLKIIQGRSKGDNVDFSNYFMH